MTDYFELLGLPRRGDLSEDEIRARYHELAKDAHPDRGGASENSAELNKAWQTLKNPVTRLRHLLEIEAPGQSTDAGLDENLMALFSRVGLTLQEAGAFLTKRQSASSALAKALLAEDEIIVQEKLQETLGQVTKRIDELDLSTESIEDLRRTYTTLSFLDKWQRQLNEKLLKLITEH